MYNPFEDLQTRLVRLEVLLLELHSLQMAAPASQTIGGVELAMQLTGLAKSTIYNLVSTQRIPHHKRGKKLYFSRAELEHWLADGKSETLRELEAEADRLLTQNPPQSC
jgi:excisionase family DNA binding protein